MAMCVPFWAKEAGARRALPEPEPTAPERRAARAQRVAREAAHVGAPPGASGDGVAAGVHSGHTDHQGPGDGAGRVGVGQRGLAKSG